MFDLIVMNPPYMRLAGLPDGYRADYEAAVAAHARGDMLYAYLQRADAPEVGQSGAKPAERPPGSGFDCP